VDAGRSSRGWGIRWEAFVCLKAEAELPFDGSGQAALQKKDRGVARESQR